MRPINPKLIVTIIAIVFILSSIPPLSAQNRSDTSGKNISEFLSPDGHFDLEAARRNGFQGSLNIDGFQSNIDTSTGQPVFRPAVSSSTTENPDDIYWDNSLSSSIPGFNGDVYALTLYNDKLIVGGIFSLAGDVPVNNIAAWDGSSWAPLGSGMNSNIFALTVYNGKLIAGGIFTTAGGVSVNRIAAWDGSSWAPLGSGMNDDVLTLSEFDGKLIAGGWFTIADGLSANGIAAWDGFSWTPLGLDLGCTVYPYHPIIRSLTVYDSKLIVGGWFTTASGSSANNIAAWDGSSWVPLGLGLNNDVLALTVYDRKLIAGGWFNTAGGVSAKRIASWDGLSWAPLGEGMNLGNKLSVNAFMVYDGKLIAGGDFATAGGVSANYIATWDGYSWAPLGLGMYNNDFDRGVFALTMYTGKLIAGGIFTIAGGSSASGIAAWDGSSWSPFSSGMIGGVNAFTVYDGKLIIGGEFTTVGEISANYIASWDGSSWSSFGEGMNSEVRALTVYDGKLIAGGGFSTAGGVSVNKIAAWDGSSWAPLGIGVSTYYPSVYALTVYGNKLIVGGTFIYAGGVTVNDIAAWDGSSWSSLGSGMSHSEYPTFGPTVRALTVYDGKLIAGGFFTHAGGVYANKIAAWDGTSWSSLGEGMGAVYNHPVYSLKVYDGNLIAGGYFIEAGGVPAYKIAAWDGSSWSPLGWGMNNSKDYMSVNALTVYNGNLIAGGSFTTADGISVNGIAEWNGSSWSPLGSGISGIGYPYSSPCISALTVYDGKLIIGGDFTIAGGKVAPYFTMWTKKDYPDAVEQFGLPSTVTLSQNYPNPFNPSTTICYDVSSQSLIVLTIYNILGQSVRTLVDKPQEAGSYRVTWDSTDHFGVPVSMGIYFYQIQVGNFSETKKMLLLK